MSCCGCASRVLKLQSEMRGWKTKLANEKREKKMILKWILTVFGYDVKVDIDKPARGIRLEATENKEAASKALLKLTGPGGTEGDFGVMVMEVKLEDQEFFEPFEEQHDVPEFPILEINSMPTNTQAAVPPPPILNTGINFGHLPQPLNSIPGLTIPTPIEVAAPVPPTPVVDQEVVYFTGDFEAGATLEVPNNGQSYIIVRTNESDDINSTIPMQMDYTTGIMNDDIITENTGGNLVFQSEPGSTAGINFLSTINPKQLAISTHAIQIPSVAVSSTPLQFSFPQVNPATVVLDTAQIPSSLPPPPPPVVQVKTGGKKRNKSQSLSSSHSSTMLIPPVANMNISPTYSKSSAAKSKKKQSNCETSSAKSKNITQSASSSKCKSISNKGYQPHTTEVKNEDFKSPPNMNQAHKNEIGLTLREKAEMYVLQKAKESIEKVNNGFCCTLCENNRSIYPNFDIAVAHTKTHFNTKPYKCDFCDELFSVQRELLTHKKTIHSKQKGTVQGISSSTSSALIQSPKMKNSGIVGITSTTTGYSPCSTTTSLTSSSPPKTIVIQSPFDNQLIRGTISSDILTAIFGAGGGGGGVVASSNQTVTSDQVGDVKLNNNAGIIVSSISEMIGLDHNVTRY